nr:isoform 2 of srsf protein kinase 2 [Quercus suber]
MRMVSIRASASLRQQPSRVSGRQTFLLPERSFLSRTSQEASGSHEMLRNFQSRRWTSSWTVNTSKTCSSSSRVQFHQEKLFLRSRYSSSSAAAAVRYGYLEGVENPIDYRVGGYHPIRIGDRLNQQYRIVHKLGHGTFSTVWLALDEETSRYVAIKVGVANAHADANRLEIDILSQLTKSAVSWDDLNRQSSLIPMVLDRFDLSGPNGTHPCFVTVPAQCSVLDAREASGSALFPLEVARSLGAQLTMAVSLVHSEGYAHGVEELYVRYGEPGRHPVIRLDGQDTPNGPEVPPYAVPPIWLGVNSSKIALGEAKLMLSDFGLAFRPDEKSRFKSYTPLVLRPPEAFFEPATALTFSSDIWTLGCVIFELFAHRSLIDGILTPQDEITAQQVHLQGLMPSEWWDRWEKRSKWYDDAGKPLSNASDIWSWERRFEHWVQNPRSSNDMGTFDDQEWDALLKLLKWMLAWKPSDRPDVKQVLETEWMTNWALPAYQKGLDMA